jgi:bifunctional ADP-heptose synthase (sugar kinase/adenylyltransferase)
MPGAPADLSGLLGRARGRVVLVVGDLMLDHFVIGRVERISPEAPVPVVQFDHEEYRLGGAANVAHNVAALGGSVEIAGLV